MPKRSIANITRDAVLAAISEHDDIGQVAFLKKYGFGFSAKYLLRHGQRSYDSKAIMGAAFGNLPGNPAPLTFKEFHGGQATVVPRLKELGFAVEEKGGRNPPWSREELILALHLYVQNKGAPLGPIHPAVVELSAFLNQLSTGEGTETFRNPNGVAMKLMNFRSLDPAFTSKGGAGLKSIGQGDRQIWQEFAHDPQGLAIAALAIRSASNQTAAIDDTAEAEPESYSAKEGQQKLKTHLVRERDPKLVEKRKRMALGQHGKLACEACQFDFAASYGPRGYGYIEAHHTKPVHALQKDEVTELADLALLCANCHRMIHSSKPWLTVEELRAIMSMARK